MDLAKHPAFAGVSPDFVHTLQQTLDSTKCKSPIEVLGLLMAVSNEANRLNIPLTAEMQQALLEYFKMQLPKNQRGQFEAVIKMLSSKPR